MKRLFLFVATLISLNIGLPGVAHADVNDFTITDFTADYYLNRDDPQGAMRVEEHISVNFTDYNHGILRAIPETYKGLPLHIKVNSVTSTSNAPIRYTTYTSNGNKVLKIGDPSQTVTGQQQYTLDYQVQNVITFYKDHDELYWDINGDQWHQPFTSVKATVHLPDGAKLWNRQPQCFAGGYASAGSPCTIAVNGKQIVAETTGLIAGQTLTVVTGFDKGYFRPASALEKIMDYEKPIVEFLAAPLIALAIGLTWWLKKGRDAKGKGTIVPEYTPPEGVSPLEAGTITDFKVDNRDITATIIDLARRGYLKIIETKQAKRLQRDTVSYQLVLQKADFAALNPYERTLLGDLFRGQTVGETMSVNKSKGKLYQTAERLRKTADDALTQQGYFRQNPKRYAVKAGSVFVIATILVYFLGDIASKDSLWPVLFGVILGVVILYLFIRQMPARTAQGVATREHLLGLKLYMETAEKDRLEKLEGPNAAYARNANEPVRTVELFEKLLPYAIVLGVEKQWAGKFKDIYTTPPEWYSGNWTAFNVGYFAGSLSGGFGSVVNAGFSAPSSSGSSGFGGGFAGGGGGGGGGGGW
jgi:uncharacterized membrane protein